jgi:phosphatidate cytidylyltransferase|tara:strand:+ start:3054 stop:3863 length:810 start_codon:yes stop_codon:yes gene_type:complete
LRIRIISASVGIPVVLLAIWLGLPGTAVLAIAAGATGGVELDRMMRPAGARVGSIRMVSLVIGPILLAVVGLWMVNDGRITGDHLPITLAIIFTLALLVRGTATLGRADRNASDWVYWVYAAYFGLALAHAPVLVDLNKGRELILLAILTTFAIDSLALFVGVSIGRRRLASTISPKKSWEGAIGGVVGGVVAAIAIDAAFDIPFTVLSAGILGAVLGVTAVVGDLYESWVKRRAGVKDSGVLIPGHGGILDRLDSVIPNLVIVYWTAV